jgi:pyridoxine kinase
MSKPAVLVLTSSVVRGAVGGRAAVFALERLGFPVWSLATVTLPWHPGHGRGARIVPDDDAFERIVDDLCAAPLLDEVGGILTGYMGSPRQPAAIGRLVDAVKARRRHALHLCDPVIGDHGALYVPEATAAAIRAELVPRADIATPNRTELAFLAGRPPAEDWDIAETARSLGLSRVAVTSAASDEAEIETLLVTAGRQLAARHRRLSGKIPNGTGDLFAALLLARLLDGEPDADALRHALGAVADMLAAAASSGADELPLAEAQESLVAPRAAIRIGP